MCERVFVCVLYAAVDLIYLDIVGILMLLLWIWIEMYGVFVFSIVGMNVHAARIVGYLSNFRFIKFVLYTKSASTRKPNQTNQIVNKSE